MASITKNESDLYSTRRLVTDTRMAIAITIDPTSTDPILANGGQNTSSVSSPQVSKGGEDDNLTLKNTIQDGN